MSEQVAPKQENPFSAVAQEYTNMCARAGHLQYQIQTFQKDLDGVNKQLEDLNFKAAAIKQKQTEEATKVATDSQAGV